jgi:DNA-directed RNA polymerase subunit RPC12/RpoP
MYQPTVFPAASGSGSVEEKVYKCIECDAVRSHRDELDENFRCRGCATQLLVSALNAIKPTGCMEAKPVKQTHKNPCSISSCKYSDWDYGDYYVYKHEVPGVYHSETSLKFCLSCAEKEFDEKIKEAAEALRKRNEALDGAIEDIENISASTRQRVRDWVHERKNNFADISAEQLVALALERVELNIQKAEALRVRNQAINEAIAGIENIPASTRQKVRRWVRLYKSDHTGKSVEELVAHARECVELESQLADISSAMPEYMACSPVRSPSKHKKKCFKCDKREWNLGEYYFYNQDNPLKTAKFCLKCAKEVFVGGEQLITAGASTSTSTGCGSRLPDSLRRICRQLSY